METEKIVESLIHHIHTPLYGIALLTGGIALIVKKGNGIHKKSEKVFYYSMSAIEASIISVLPNHESPFLFSIGLRSLDYKQKEFQFKTDKIIAYLIIITGLSMILCPLTLYGKINMILTVFGIVGYLGCKIYSYSGTLNDLRKAG